MTDLATRRFLDTASRQSTASFPIANGVTLYPGALVQTEGGYLNHWDGTGEFQGVLIGGDVTNGAFVGNTSAIPVPEGTVDISGVTLRRVLTSEGSALQTTVGDLIYCPDSDPSNLTLDVNGPPIGVMTRFRSVTDVDVTLFTPHEHRGVADLSGTADHAAGTVLAPGASIGSTTVGLFSGGTAGTEYLGLGSNQTEFARGLAGALLLGGATANANAYKLLALKTGAGIQSPIGLQNATAAAADVGSSLQFVGESDVVSGSIRSAWAGAATTAGYVALVSRVGDALTEVCRANSLGNFLIGTSTGRSAKLNVSGSVSAISMSDSMSTSTNKAAILSLPRYDTPSSSIGHALIYANNNATNCFLNFGGGNSGNYCATVHRFYVAANTSTTTGTNMGWLSTTGLRLESGAAAAAESVLHVVGTSSNQFRIGYSATNYGLITVNSVGIINITPTSSGHTGEQVAINGHASGTVSLLYLNQPSTGGAPFVRYQGVSDTDLSDTITTLTTSGTPAGHLKINVNGTDYWMAFYATPS